MLALRTACATTIIDNGSLYGFVFVCPVTVGLELRFGNISPQTKLTAFCDLLIRMIALVGHNFGNGGIDSRSLKISLSFSHRFNQCVLICLRAVHDDRRQDHFRLKVHGMFRLHTQPGAPIFHARDAGIVICG